MIESIVRKLVVLLTLLIISGMIGCAGPRNVMLLYHPQDEYGNVDSVFSAVTKLSQPFSIALSFEDRRINKENLGIVKNSYGKELGSVFAKNDMMDWIKNAVQVYLEEKKYTLLMDQEEVRHDSIPIIYVYVDQVTCNSYKFYDGTVTISLSMTPWNDTTKIIKKYTGKGSTGENYRGKPEKCAQSLSIALDNAVKKIEKDIHKTFILSFKLSFNEAKKNNDINNFRKSSMARIAQRGAGAAAARASAKAKSIAFKKRSELSRTDVVPSAVEKQSEKHISLRKEILVTISAFLGVLGIITIIGVAKD